MNAEYDSRRLLSFIEMHGFYEDWIGLGCGDDELMALQYMIIRSPTSSPVIPGTGGLRKLRFARSKGNIGKRGGVRVCYAYFPDAGIVLLVRAYPKSKKDDLAAQEKKTIKQFLDKFGKDLSR